jgi:hypothetical protein
MFGVGNPLGEILNALQVDGGFAPFAHQPAAPVAPVAPTVPPPASFRVRSALPLIKVTADDIIEVSNKECLICLIEHELGAQVAKLPCGHIYHEECIKEWLKIRCTCPGCRYELPTDDPLYEADRVERMKKSRRYVVRCRREELDGMSISRLKALLTQCSVSFAGCVDKFELVERLLSSGCVEIVEGIPPKQLSAQEFEALSVAELKQLVLSFGLSMPWEGTRAVVEKAEIRRLLLDSGRVQLTNAPADAEIDVGDVKQVDGSEMDVVISSSDCDVNCGPTACDGSQCQSDKMELEQ